MRTNALYYVYALVDPRDDVPHYVGITIDPAARLRDHNGGISANDAKDAWIAELKRSGLKPMMKILEEGVSDEHIAERERYWIHAYLSAGYPLTNIHIHPHQSFAIQREGWVSIKQATRQLKIEGYRVDANKISNLANRGRIHTKEDALDERVKLVDLDELRIILAPRRVTTNSSKE